MTLQDRISKAEWHKKVSGNFSVLTACYNALFDTRAVKERFGAGFERILFFHRDHRLDYYRTAQDTKHVGTFLATRVTKDSSEARMWSAQLHRASDRVIRLMSQLRHRRPTVSGLSRFESALADFHAFLMAVYSVADYLPPDSDLLPVLRQARIYSEPVYDRVEQLIDSWAIRIANQERGYHQSMLVSLTPSELREYLSNSQLPPAKTLQDRYKSAAFYYEAGRLLLSLTGARSEDLASSLYSKSPIAQRLTGMTAYPGKVVGRAFIVTDPTKAHGFRQGDILVTGMTRPDFLPLIRKSAAIITDAGGRLSHAAIVARELRIPCIVATEVATHTLRDGEMIEIDADNGTVKRLT